MLKSQLNLSLESPMPEQNSDYVINQIEEWAEIMYNEIDIRDYTNGCFTRHRNCCKGGQIFSWLLDKVVPDHKKAKEYCQ